MGDFELCLYDVNPSSLGGANEEYIFSARLDNLCMSYCGLEALIKATNESSNLAQNPNILVLGLFDNEEVGSQTAHGADSNLLPVTVKRLASIRMGEQHVVNSNIDSIDSLILKSAC
jgi:aspartyl aminopeptidase